MMMNDKKKIASIIVSKMKPNGTEQSQDLVPKDKMPDQSDALMSIADNLIQALVKRDAGDVAAALANFWGAMEAAEDAEEEVLNPEFES